jgi:hypothetical protein
MWTKSLVGRQAMPPKEDLLQWPTDDGSYRLGVGHVKPNSMAPQQTANR